MGGVRLSATLQEANTCLSEASRVVLGRFEVGQASNKHMVGQRQAQEDGVELVDGVYKERMRKQEGVEERRMKERQGKVKGVNALGRREKEGRRKVAPSLRRLAPPCRGSQDPKQGCYRIALGVGYVRVRRKRDSARDQRVSQVLELDHQGFQPPRVLALGFRRLAKGIELGFKGGIPRVQVVDVAASSRHYLTMW